MDVINRRIKLSLTAEQQKILVDQFGINAAELLIEGELTAVAEQRATAEGRIPVQGPTEPGPGKVWIIKDVDMAPLPLEMSDTELDKVAGGLGKEAIIIAPTQIEKPAGTFEKPVAIQALEEAIRK
jgi:hypothetical protein